MCTRLKRNRRRIGIAVASAAMSATCSAARATNLSLICEISGTPHATVNAPANEAYGNPYFEEVTADPFASTDAITDVEAWSEHGTAAGPFTLPSAGGWKQVAAQPSSPPVCNHYFGQQFTVANYNSGWFYWAGYANQALCENGQADGGAWSVTAEMQPAIEGPYWTPPQG